ncbi:iron chaperone [Archangium lansingense]|uniref:iron chaperone n=1 Tax=Archangium lansingense TaxID=2995310 RepID=UPI003B7FDEB5
MATNPRELQPIDAYLEGLKDPAAKKTLGALRMQLRKLLPGAIETISYQMPTFKVDGKAVAGFAFFKTHCGYYPFSGSVVPALKAQLDGYATSKSGVTFPPDKPLPAKLVKTLVQARLEGDCREREEARGHEEDGHEEDGREEDGREEGAHHRTRDRQRSEGGDRAGLEGVDACAGRGRGR